ncbi:MAG: hemolysin family protein [Candidatus Pacebacteria bacterium]|nr:hemolysin family protein [Candidatus Paceibacterota bacterium]
METIIVLLLIILNGVFAMSEIAIVSARKTKLQSQANEGNENAQTALALAKSPNRFLSTVQIGITFIGIFAGAFGGGTIAISLAKQIDNIPLLAPYSEVIGLFSVVAVITYLSLVIGELVPKRIALSSPERTARLVAKPMNFLSTITAPLVSLLTFSTDVALNILNIEPPSEPVVTDEEIKLLMREGTEVGIFETTEKDIVERTLRLGDKKIYPMLTPRGEIQWLNTNHPFESIKNRIIKEPHSYFPVCRDGLDKVLGIIQTKDLLADFMSDRKIDLEKSMHKPIFVPETMEALDVLELFKTTGIHIALVVDEYGSVIGLLSLSDILSEIVGDIPTADALEEEDFMKRDDGSYLVDGLVPIDEFKSFFKIKKIPGLETEDFHTLGGFAMDMIGRIPVSGDKFELGQFNFEVVDMDENRVDKVMVTPKQ